MQGVVISMATAMDTAQALLTSVLARLDAAEQSLREKDVQIHQLQTAIEGLTAVAAVASSAEPAHQHSPATDTRMLETPGVFPGTQESLNQQRDERPHAEWVMTFRARATGVSPGVRDLKDYVAKGDTLDKAFFAEDVLPANQMYYILAMAVKEEALEKLKLVVGTNELEFWRCSQQEWKPMRQAGFTGLLTGILEREYVYPLVPSAGVWERSVCMFDDKKGVAIPESAWVSVLSQGFENPEIMQHIALNVSSLEMGEIVNNSMASRSETRTDEPVGVLVPMEIGVVQPEGGRGKGKGEKSDVASKGEGRKGRKGVKASEGKIDTAFGSKGDVASEGKGKASEGKGDTSSEGKGRKGRKRGVVSDGKGEPPHKVGRLSTGSVHRAPLPSSATCEIMVIHKKPKKAKFSAKFNEKIVRVICLATDVKAPARMLILGKSLKHHEIVELDFKRFIDKIRFDPFEPSDKTFTIHTVKVDFWKNGTASELLAGCEGILTEHLSDHESMTSAELLNTLSELGLDCEV
jgi:hypothetical protein